MVKKSISGYLQEIHRVFSQGDAREESYYDLLKRLILQTAGHLDRSWISVTTMPRKTEGGNPDFRVWDGKAKIVGYIEAKRPDIDLDDVEESEQVRRYRDIFPNFMLTNFLEFRFYRDGALIERLFIGRRHTLVQLSLKPVVENEGLFLELFNKFFSFTFPRNLNARQLARELAKRTRFLRDQVIIEELKGKPEDGHNPILGFYKAFKKYLIIDLEKEGFADLYAQTITYGLFAARTRCRGEFHRKNALEFIPQTIGLLHDVFGYISVGQAPEQLEWIIDDIAEVLASVDVEIILKQFYQEGKGEDPIVHFYETFLSEYDPQIREKRGVYYTPEPVVSFIVRSLHRILKEHFGKPDGLADIHIKILDPAAGTLTFITEAAKLALNEYLNKYGEGVKEGFIRSHLLQNLYAFELMMAPYAVGHLKMSYILEEMKFRLPKEERFQLYLTNTLEMQDIEQTDFPFYSTLSDESRLAGKVKKQTPILVILGNPPYSGISVNIGPWITDQIESYKYVDGKHFGERKHWLQDDYVKFIRFAQWKIDQNGEGVLGFITNHSYLDNPTFRGMRQSLMKSFDEIYLLDLHGNTLKKEKCPDGSKDGNVFDIRQGVAIALMIKKKPGEGGSDCNVFHSEIWGLRGNKYDWLSKYEIDSVDWKQINPTSPYYFFIPREEKNREIYEQYWKVTDIFPVNVSGIVTARDHFVIDFDEGSLKRRIEMFNNISIPDEIIRASFKLKDTRGWKLAKARKELSEDDNWGKYIAKILYRPFDIRSILYSQKMVDWPRLEFMSNMFYENLGLITNRQVNGDFRHALCTNMIINDCTVSLETRERSYLYPLYLYPDRSKKGLFSEVEGQDRRANIEEKFFRFLEAGLVDQGGGAVKVTPEEIFYYIYAVLYANIYRQKYAEFLKIDFPRVPFTADYRLFVELAKLGRALADIHLMKSPELDDTFARFEKAGTNQVQRVKYDDDGRVFINNEQYFSPIPPEIWQYRIGGYQVMHKWLKDRKGRSLALEDIQHYIRISRALELTIRCQEKIDHLYPQVEESLLNIQAPNT